MFTGIIEELGAIEKIEVSRQPCLLTVKARNILVDMNKGDSISVDGVCLTAVDIKKESFSAEAIKETLNRTTLGALRRADKVNLEASLRMSARLGGHFVTGHVDGIGTIIRKQRENGSILFEIEAEERLLEGIVWKGSVAVDGISLTVAEVKSGSFCVYVIPHTAEMTTLGFKGKAGKVNVETDILGRYVQKFLNRNQGSGITEDFLREKGII
ncbi:MAG: riboflavin synthase [Candidatus Omnitrophota bacterium]